MAEDEQKHGTTYFYKQLLMTIFAVGSLTTFVYHPNAYVAVGCVLGLTLLGRVLDRLTTAGAMVPTAGRAVLVTGSDSECGVLLAGRLAALDVVVFAGCQNASSPRAAELRALEAPGVHVLQLDVSSSRDVRHARDYVTRTLAGNELWGVVNLASTDLTADVELLTMEQIEMIVEVNQLGMVRVTKAFLPLIRKSKGRIINVTGMMGLLPEVYHGACAMTKAAGEAFSDVLRMEVRRFGVRVIVVEPSGLGALDEPETRRNEAEIDNIWKDMSPELRHTYGKEYVLHHSKTILNGLRTLDPERQAARVAEWVIKALFLCEPSPRYLVGSSDKYLNRERMRITMNTFLPSWYMDGLVLYDVRHYPNPRALVGQPHSHSH